METRQQFQREIDGLRASLVEMASAVVAQVERAVDAWENHDERLAAEVIGRDDDIDNRCAELDRGVFNIQLLEAPVAADLRLLHVGLITAVALERVGDLALAIARRVPGLPMGAEVPDVQALIQRMEPRALGALAGSVQALARGDLELADRSAVEARSVIGLLDDVLVAVSATTSSAPEAHAWLASAVLVARHLERVANNAAEISGRVHFLVTGATPGAHGPV